MEVLKLVFEFLGPVLVAAVTIIPTIINNRKKTENSIREMVDEIKEDNQKTNDKVDALSQQLDKHIRENEDDNAKQIRARILRAYDDLCGGKLMSESHFEDILQDIDYYEEYVSMHPDFKNNRTKMSASYIIASYQEHLEKHDFLVPYSRS